MKKKSKKFWYSGNSLLEGAIIDVGNFGKQYKEEIQAFIPSQEIINRVNEAIRLGKPILVTGEAGTGKTRLGQAIAYERYGNKYQDYFFRWRLKSTSSINDAYYVTDQERLNRDKAILKEGEKIIPEDYLSLQILGNVFTTDWPAILEIENINLVSDSFLVELFTELEEKSFHIRETGKQIIAQNSPLVIFLDNGLAKVPELLLRNCVIAEFEFPNMSQLEKMIHARFYTKIDRDDTHKLIDVFLEIRRIMVNDPDYIFVISTSQLFEWANILAESDDENKEHLFEGFRNRSLNNRAYRRKDSKPVAPRGELLLDYSNQNLKEFPQEIWDHPALEILILNNNQISSIPREIGQLSRLKYLFLYNNQLSSLPSEIAEFTSLQLIELSQNPLDSFPSPLANLPNLSYLGLPIRAIQDVPESVSRLPLKFFNLSKDTFRLDGDKILPPGKIIGAHEAENFPMDLLKFTQLKELDLSSHHFRHIPEEIGKLEKLEALYMFGNNFKEFPSGLTKLSSLKKLQIAYNQIEKIPTSDILKLSKLEQLVLANNKIRLFPPDLLQLPKLTSGGSEEYSEYDKTLLNLDFRNNPIRNVPPEIIDKGYDAIFQYFESLQAGESRALNSAKLVIVGQGGVGKTVLSRKLIEPELAFEQIQEASTEGIDIRPWFISDGAEDRIRCNIWDFGGQEIYRSTHRFFLSKRSVYILVSETRREDDYQDFNYWLNTIQVQSDGSPVIIVINKIDERTKSINEVSLKARFPEIIGFHYVSCKSGKGLKKLREGIQQIILQLPHTKDEVPLGWISIAQELEKIRLTKDNMKYGEFLQICKKQGVATKTASLLLEYFHDLGLLLYFKKDVILSATIILNPDWGTNAIYNVLDTSEVVQNHGKFTYTQLYQIWAKDEYDSQSYGSLIALMKQFNLCIQLNDPQEYLVPQLLSPTSPHFTFEHKGKRVIEYHYPEFKPSGILTQILVELRPDIKEDICWKYGFLLAYGETEVLITEEPISRKIMVKVAGPKKDEILENIMGQIRDIHRKYPKLSYREYIPCNCEFRKAGDPSFLFEYERLQNFLDAGRNSLVCYQCIQEISIPSILKGITFRQERDEQSIKQLPVTEQHSILFLSANPLESGRSRLEKEYAEIEESIIRARMRDRFLLKAKWALRVEDLQRGMLEFSPRILHFSGHVDKNDHSMLLLETEAGEAKAVSSEALSSLFDLFKNTLECIILSAGFSLDLARPLLKRTSYVISMKENLSDRTAIIFSRSFYDAIGQGRKIPFAFEFGKSALRLEGIPETELPVFLSNG